MLLKLQLGINILAIALPRITDSSPRKETMMFPIQTAQHLSGKSTYSVYTLWLFTRSDLKTIVFPCTAFGVLNTLAISIGDDGENHQRTDQDRYYHILRKTPLLLLWAWINLLPFAINNQRQPEAVEEDRMNKPWRPMPSGRISPKVAKWLMFIMYLLAVILSRVLRNLAQSLTLIVLGFWYNNLRGADSNCLIRNFINACGFICFTSGTMQVAVGKEQSALLLLGWWYSTIACIVFSTVQTQDMYDQRGDAVRKRSTVPIAIGDGLARWTIAIPMILWCWLVPFLWKTSTIGYIPSVLLGLSVAYRSLRNRSELADKQTFRLWNLWMVSIYMLPMIKAYEEFVYWR